MIAVPKAGPLHLAGWLLTAASAAFLVVVAQERWGEIEATGLTPGQWGLIASLAVAYGFSLFLLAGAWHGLLRFVGAEPSGPAQSIHAFSTSQLAKYVPGNVFHLVGRHFMLRSAGIPDGKLALASALEIVLMLIGAGGVVTVAIVSHPPAALEGAALSAVRFVPAVYGLALISALLVARIVGKGNLLWLLVCLAAYGLFFALMGGTVAMIVAMVARPDPLAVAGGGVAAWMVGFVTPGAPAGLGTREAAMLLFVGNQVTASALIVSAALFRLVTFVGDLVCFGAGWLLFGPKARALAV